MTSPLDEKGLQAAIEAQVGDGCAVREYLDFTAEDAKSFGVDIEGENFAKLDVVRHQQYEDAGLAIISAAIRAYLAVSQPIGDGMEVVAWERRLMNCAQAVNGRKMGEWGPWERCTVEQAMFAGRWEGVEGFPPYLKAEARPLVTLSSAAALVAAKDARIEELTRERDEATDAFKHLIVAMAQERLGVGDKEGGGLFIRNTRAETAEAQVSALRAALEGLLSHYTELVNSGDAGNWNPETDGVVIIARQALKDPK